MVWRAVWAGNPQPFAPSLRVEMGILGPATEPPQGLETDSAPQGLGEAAWQPLARLRSRRGRRIPLGARSGAGPITRCRIGGPWPSYSIANDGRLMVRTYGTYLVGTKPLSGHNGVFMGREITTLDFL